MAPNTRAMMGSTTSRKRGHAASPEPQSRSTSSGSSDAGAVTRQDGNQDGYQTAGSPQTPKPQKKRARFSDPGPNATTGLTPAMGRAGLGGRRRASGGQTPSRSGRRQSAPIFLSDTLIDPVIAGRTEPITVQFSPLKQVLDPRARRRLVRSGLSEEMNRIDGEKKDLKQATAEIESLQKKLEIYESQQASGAHGNNTFDDNFETMPIDDDTLNGTMLMSDSPTFHRYHDAHGLSSGNSTSPEDMSPITPHTGFPQPVSIMDDQPSEELRMMAEDLAAVRKEKQDLFNEWRKLNPSSSTEPEAEATAPPADFMKQIVPRLEAALRTESELTQTLQAVEDELIRMGFSGPDLYGLLAAMRESFESAWEELKLHNSKGSLPARDDGKAILETFITHIQQVSQALMNEHQRLKTVSDAHENMKRQFDYTVGLFNAEQDKVKKLEESQDANTDDMLHNRMRMQELEQEIKDNATSIERLNQNLKVVEEERDRYGILCGQVEEEQRGERQTSEQRIAALEKSVTDITKIADDRSKKIDAFKDSLVDKEVAIDQLVKRIEELHEENMRLIRERDQKIGRLNTRIADASTELRSTQADLDQTRLVNNVLKTHNQQLVASRNRLENFFNTTMTQFSKAFDVERERDRQHEITMDIMSGNGHKYTQRAPMQLEPSLPTNSPFRASRDGSLDNVRLGRGKDRRTLFSSELGLDSGIGGSETAQPQTDAPAGSDAFLEAVDEEDDNIE